MISVAETPPIPPCECCDTRTLDAVTVVREDGDHRICKDCWLDGSR